MSSHYLIQVRLEWAEEEEEVDLRVSNLLLLNKQVLFRKTINTTTTHLFQISQLTINQLKT